jgi:COMPASS component SDC1
VTTTTATGFAMPSEAAAHGAPVRQYLNSKVTGVLLEGMKIVAREQ